MSTPAPRGPDTSQRHSRSSVLVVGKEAEGIDGGMLGSGAEKQAGEMGKKGFQKLRRLERWGRGTDGSRVGWGGHEGSKEGRRGGRKAKDRS